MKAPWVALLAVGALVVGLLGGLFVGFAAGLWVGQDAAGSGMSAPPTAEPLPQLALEVFADGCGVVRSEVPADVHYTTLTWVFRDADGFQVLGRAAENETRYRYFAPGQYSVVLEAHDGERYQRVSNEVTVSC